MNSSNEHAQQKIIHIDMDCFYAAIEMRDNPELQNIPIIVGGKATQRGVVATANYIARKYGIHSAMPTAQAIKLCPTLVVVPNRMAVYKEVSVQIQQIFSRYTQLIEPLSLDEAYLDVTDSELYQGSATMIARAIRHDIKAELNLTASAGIAPIKFLAKISSDINKPDNQFTIAPEDVQQFLLTLPLTKIPGVGKVTANKLASMNLLTCKDVQQFDLGLLLKRFGKFGYTLYNLCHGIDKRTVHRRKRKSVGVERTLIKDIDSWDDCLTILEKLYLELIARAGRSSSSFAISKQGIKFKFDDFQSTTQEHTTSVIDKETLFALAQDAWLSRRNGRKIRLVGLQVTLPEEKNQEAQLQLFSPE